jgi:hypothetical protein
MGRDKRVHIRSAFIGGLVAALTVMALPAVAAEVAAALQLGQSNTAHARTTLTGSVRSANLLIVNTHPGGSPLSLVSRPGEPPLKVNRVAKVRNLNADRVDGLSAHQLVRVAHAATNNVDEAIFGGGSDADVLTVTVKAPRTGFLVIGAAIDAFGNAFDDFGCRLAVDDTFVAGTLMGTRVHSAGGDHTINSEENCSPTGVQPVTAGTHTVDLQILGRDTVLFSRASLWAMYVPFDGEGK